MTIMSNTSFENHLERKFKGAPPVDNDNDHSLLFTTVSEFINVDVYVKLLASLEATSVQSFARFFLICLRKHTDRLPPCKVDLAFVKDDLELQVLMMLCLQYYFS